MEMEKEVQPKWNVTADTASAKGYKAGRRDVIKFLSDNTCWSEKDLFFEVDSNIWQQLLKELEAENGK